MAFNFIALESGKPLDAHTIRVRKAGTTDLIDTAAVLKLDGSALGNPFTVSDAGGEQEWGFIVASEQVYDVYWDEQTRLVAREQHNPLKELPVTKAVDYTAVLTDKLIIVDASSATVAITLFSAAGLDGKIITVKCLDSTNAATVVPDGAETIDGAAGAFSLVKHEVLTLASDGTNWILI